MCECVYEATARARATVEIGGTVKKECENEARYWRELVPRRLLTTQPLLLADHSCSVWR